VLHRGPLQDAGNADNEASEQEINCDSATVAVCCLSQHGARTYLKEGCVGLRLGRGNGRLDAKIIGWLLAMLDLARQVPVMASDAALCQRLEDDGDRLAITAYNRRIVAVKYWTVIKRIVGRNNLAISCLSVDR
jgi:hypothetical protein